MEINELENRLKQNKIDSLYFFYGEEVYLLEQCLKRIKKIFGPIVEGINYIKIDSTNIDTLIDNIEVPAFGYEKKLIIVRDSGLFLKRKKKNTKKNEKEQEENKDEKKKDQSGKIAEYIENNLDQIKETTIIIFIERETQENALGKVLKKYAITCNFELQNSQELTARIIEISKMYGVNIDNSTAMYLIENCGQEMLTLINELRKQIEYVGKGGTIKKEAIDDLACKRIEGYIFDLTDSIGVSNTKKALKVLEDLLYTKEPIQMILIILYGHFKKLYFTKIALREKLDVARTLNLSSKQSFLVNKYVKQSSYFSEEKIRTIIQELIDLDYKYKTGSIDVNIGLESILCRYCSK